ncbi:MAG: hypothetical protein GY940_25000, partial [bacterium]|nr:hypothetical protein [bacterium]
ERLIRRHQSLRTVFLMINEEPRQKVLTEKETGFSVETLDLSDESIPRRSRRIKALVSEESRRVFDLKTGPLMIARLIRTGPRDYIFILNMHHIISDGWSMAVMIREIFNTYNAEVRNEHFVTESPDIQYKDFSAWQNRLLTGKEFNRHRAYWMDKFKGEVPVLELPCDFLRPTVKSYNGKLFTDSLSIDTTQKVTGLGLEQNTSLFMVLVAAVKTLLYRYTGQEDIVVGSPVSGRIHKDLENQIGFYVNTLALHTVFDGTLSFERLLAQVKGTALGAYDHELYPFDQLVEDLQLTRDTSRSPLFDVMVALNPDFGSGPDQHMEGITISQFNTDLESSKFDLRFGFAQISDSIHMTFLYNCDLFAPSRIRRMSGHFRQLIDSITAAPQTPLNKLGYLSEAETYRLLYELNDTRSNFPKDKTIHRLFSEQADRTPDRVALSAENTPGKFSGRKTFGPEADQNEELIP